MPKKKKKEKEKVTPFFFYIMEYQPKLIPVAPGSSAEILPAELFFWSMGVLGNKKKQKTKKTVGNKLPGPPGPMDRQEGGRSVWSEGLIA